MLRGIKSQNSPSLFSLMHKIRWMTGYSSTRSSFRNSRTSTVVLEFPGFVNVRGDDGLDGDGDEDSGHLVIVTLMVVVGMSCR